jgi:hypothetical protein
MPLTIYSFGHTARLVCKDFILNAGLPNGVCGVSSKELLGYSSSELAMQTSHETDVVQARAHLYAQVRIDEYSLKVARQDGPLSPF